MSTQTETETPTDSVEHTDTWHENMRPRRENLLEYIDHEIERLQAAEALAREALAECEADPEGRYHSQSYATADDGVFQLHEFRSPGYLFVQDLTKVAILLPIYEAIKQSLLNHGIAEAITQADFDRIASVIATL